MYRLDTETKSLPLGTFFMFLYFICTHIFVYSKYTVDLYLYHVYSTVDILLYIFTTFILLLICN